jgi:hypothetical protein
MVHRRAAHASRSKERIHICATPPQQRPRTAERVLVPELCAHRAAAANGREESHLGKGAELWHGGNRDGGRFECSLQTFRLDSCMLPLDGVTCNNGQMADAPPCGRACRLQTQSWFSFCSSVSHSLNFLLQVSCRFSVFQLLGGGLGL